MKTLYRRLIIYFCLLFLIFIAASNAVKSSSDYNDEDTTYLAQYLNPAEINFAIEQNIPLEELKLYLPYHTFNVYNFYEYQSIRYQFNYSPLEAINCFNNPHYYDFYDNPKDAIGKDTPNVLVNKCFYLNHDYTPTDLVNVNKYPVDYIDRKNDEILIKKEAMEHFLEMYLDAKNNHIELTIFSGYRSYEKQKILYFNVYFEDDSVSARPGFSEHQTGYAIDISTRSEGLTERFADTDSFEWLNNHCFKYGFILRYPKGKEHLTGYQFEPWHYRYVGDIASNINYQNLCLEEYFFSNIEI